MLEKWEVLTLLAVVLGMLTPVILVAFGPTMDRWFRVLEKWRDLPSVDDILIHLIGHQFTMLGECLTCRRVGEGRGRPVLGPVRPEWAAGYEAGYVDGHDNRPRTEP